VLLTYAMLRGRNQPAGNAPLPHQPPVVVINAGEKSTTAAPPALPAVTSAAAPRQWTVIGDVDNDD
jgi:hypothetical protein